MATVNYIQEKTQSASVMKKVIDYCSRADKTIEQKTGIRYLSGVNCDGTNAYEDFIATKMLHRKTSGFMFYHYDQSFHPDENITHAKAHEIAKEFAEKAWPGYEVLVATHCDAKHIHSHFVVNSVSFQDGKKLHQTPNTLKELRELSDEICQKHGLSTLPPKQKKKAKDMSAREYRTVDRMTSWKMRLIAAINMVMTKAKTKDEFVKFMKDLGYDVAWTDSRKYITYTTPDGYRCRDNRLHKDKYLKEHMEYEFRIREEIQRSDDRVHAGSEDRGKRDSILYYQRRELESSRPGIEVTGHTDRHDQIHNKGCGDERCPEMVSGSDDEHSYGTRYDLEGRTERSGEDVERRVELKSDDLSGGTDETGWETERAICFRLEEDAEGIAGSDAGEDREAVSPAPVPVSAYDVVSVGANLAADLVGIVDSRPKEEGTPQPRPVRERKNRQKDDRQGPTMSM